MDSSDTAQAFFTKQKLNAIAQTFRAQSALNFCFAKKTCRFDRIFTGEHLLSNTQRMLFAGQLLASYNSFHSYLCLNPWLY